MTIALRIMIGVVRRIVVMMKFVNVDPILEDQMPTLVPVRRILALMENVNVVPMTLAPTAKYVRIQFAKVFISNWTPNKTQIILAIIFCSLEDF